MHVNKMKIFLDTVRDQIRWKKAQPILINELENHIVDQTLDYMEDGLDENTASDKAIEEMGDPIGVGQQLDRVHRPKPDWIMLIITILLLTSGLIIQYQVAIAQGDMYSLERQIFGVLVSIIALLVGYFIDFTILEKHSKLILISLFIIIFATILFSNSINGAKREAIYPLLLLPTVFAGFIYSMRSKGYGGIILCGVSFTIFALTAYMIPSMTTLIFLMMVCIPMLIIAIYKGLFQVRKKMAFLLVFLPISVFLGIIATIILQQSWRIDRLKAMIDPNLDPIGTGYIRIVVTKIIQQSKMIGQGLPIEGHVVENIGQIVPSLDSNFIITFLIYRFGWILFIGLVALMFVYIIRAIILCNKQRSKLGYLVSLSIILTITMQCLIYIISNLGISSISQLSFPFLSYGGKYLIINMFLIGLLLSVFRTGDYVKDKREMDAFTQKIPFIQYESGTIKIHLK